MYPLSDDWKHFLNKCASSAGENLLGTNHKKGDAGILKCKDECKKKQTCSAIEWYHSGWDGSKCKLILGAIPATQGKTGPRWQDARCFIKPGL